MTLLDVTASTTTTETTPTRTHDAVGTANTRVEGIAKVTGQARYAGDIPFAELAHGWLVLSTVARGRIRSIDAEPVLAMPGVLAVLHHENAPRLKPGVGLMGPDASTLLLQDDRVPYRGWPVALVVAETAEQARAAAEALVVTYEEEPHDVVFTAGHPGAYTPESSRFVQPDVERGDVEAELAASAVVVDEEYTTPEQYHNAMEPHAAMARWEDGRLEVVDSNQGSHAVAQLLAALFSLDGDSVRVRSEHVGGAFGSKGFNAHLILAVMAATQLDRPVRVVLTRRQMFSLVGYRPATAQRVRLGADADGRLRALDHESVSLSSALQQFVEASTRHSRALYGADALRVRTKVVPLDVGAPSFMRAPGWAPGSFAVESAMDELADKSGEDPIRLRVRNEPAVAPGSGLPFSSRNIIACYEEGARRFGWADRDPRPGTRRDGRWALGLGMAASAHSAGVAPATASITAEADGTFTVRIAAADIGTGARTALILIAADALAVPKESVRMKIADSDFGPAFLAGGSMGTTSWAWAITEAAVALSKKVVPGDPIPPEGIMARADTTELVGGREQRESLGFGAQFAEVAVDVATGEVRVRRMLGVFAVGRVVNPTTARSQLIGGMTWGLSMALHEEGVRDVASGGLANADLAAYHFASNADVPVIEADWVDDPDTYNPSGIKGLGEIGIVGGAAAIANAVWHATGVRQRHLPIRLDRVLMAGAASGGGA
ncbi:xanthine dehydrogenase family protein molybdopterin-binding subunit [Actinoallomurus bryophytorum]|uniref:Xanthine dehydrogenase molybdenum binding subunit apoprotein n=1 Tax=Actinoallomurus bryophytorum TaxID=1490222 RepID=A0A543CDW9_9ACTN|nr:xanthine dehydrogenase family protein molybdopterin-binding subunit [Actinoallomurus bryophytorum]TQL95296.1 xanthine dehydrogenase molybdenum binding subunit apoprotein [Actinoallomurus bryophytorum]